MRHTVRKKVGAAKARLGQTAETTAIKLSECGKQGLVCKRKKGNTKEKCCTSVCLSQVLPSTATKEQQQYHSLSDASGRGLGQEARASGCLPIVLLC